MSKITFKNNYELHFEDFKKDTGLDPKKDVEIYITYHNARMTDMLYQLNVQMGQLILNKIGSANS